MLNIQHWAIQRRTRKLLLIVKFSVRRGNSAERSISAKSCTLQEVIVAVFYLHFDDLAAAAASAVE